MKFSSILTLTFAALLAVACGSKGGEQAQEEPKEAPSEEMAKAESPAAMTPEQIFEQEFATATIKPEAGTPASPSAAAVMYAVDTDASTVMWRGYKIGAVGAHYGTLGIAKGEFAVASDAVEAGSVEFDMTKIEAKDLTDDEKIQKLEGHLKAPDFFNVEEFPTSSIEITGIESLEGDAANIHGNLTIKGITHEIVFPATVMFEGTQMKAKAMFTYDRSEYDVKWGSQSFPDLLGDVIVSDDIQMYLDLTANAPASASAY